MNFTRAAEELHISQPALHVKVQKLAAAVGVPLYVRSGRRLELTTAGHSLAEFARRFEVELDELLVRLGASEEEPLVVAAGQGAHRYVISEAVRLLLSRGSRLRLLTTNREDTIAAVRSGGATVGVAVLASCPPELEAVELARYPQVAILPSGHQLARRRRLRLRDLDGAELVVPPPGRPQRAALDEAVALAGISVSVAGEAEGWAQMLHFVGLGVGICVVNGCVAPGPAMVARPIEDLPTVTYSALLRTAVRNRRRVMELLDALRTSTR